MGERVESIIETRKATEAIIQAFHSSIGTTSPSRELNLREKADVLIHIECHLKELKDVE
jgi:hypothetical protein